MFEGFDLTGRVAVITGGARGIGGGIAEVLAEAGAEVVIADRLADQAEEKAAELRASGHQASAVPVNLLDESSVVAACRTVTERPPSPWLLVNNAGVHDRQLLLEGTAEDWDRIVGINARGAYLMTRELARAMVAGGQGGRIVNVASTVIRGMICHGHSAYAASKGAMSAFTMAAALELAPHGITVNTVLPGGVASPGATEAKGPPPSGPGHRASPLGLSEPRDIAAAVLFFASPAARMVTNQELAVDAGFSIA